MLYNNLPGVPIMNSHQHSKHILHALHSTQQQVSVPLPPSVKLVSNLFVLCLAWPIIIHCLEMLCSSSTNSNFFSTPREHSYTFYFIFLSPYILLEAFLLLLMFFFPPFPNAFTWGIFNQELSIHLTSAN